MKRIILITDAGDRLEAEVTNETFRLLRACTGRKTRCGDWSEEALVTRKAFRRIRRAMKDNGLTAGEVIDCIVEVGLTGRWKA